jgi:hypothetical protein
MQRLREVAVPALGTKLVGVGEPTVVAMHRPRAEPNLRSFRHQITADLDVFPRFASERPRRRIETKRLRDDEARVLETRDIGDGRRSIAEHFVELLRELRAKMRMTREEQERPREGQCGRLVSREEERETLVAKLLVRHA